MLNTDNELRWQTFFLFCWGGFDLALNVFLRQNEAGSFLGQSHFLGRYFDYVVLCGSPSTSIL